jgi:hypothetical protein
MEKQFSDFAQNQFFDSFFELPSQDILSESFTISKLGYKPHLSQIGVPHTKNFEILKFL